MAMGIRCADHVTLYPQKLALTSPTSGGRSVGIVRFRTTGHGVYLIKTEVTRWKVVISRVLNFPAYLRKMSTS
jgi:hypothetical protein